MSELAVFTLPDDVLDELRRAKKLLEDSTAIGRALALPAKLLASGTASMGRLLPERFREAVEEASVTALRAACAAATWGADAGPKRRGSMALAAGLGAVGGAGGLPGALIELPVTTTLILRRIAQIAAEEGEDISQDAVRAECVTVFALGGPGPAEATTDSAYYATRVGLARMIDGAARTGLRAILPAVLRPVAARFAAVAEAKLAAQAVPVLGAISGAAINAAFIAHFERRARGHFVVRRLEREYGADAVRTAYTAAP